MSDKAEAHSGQLRLDSLWGCHLIFDYYDADRNE